MIPAMLPERRVFRTGLAMFAAAWVLGCGDSMTMADEPAPAPNRPPAAVGTIPAATLAIGESTSLNVSTYFEDPDGDPLTYRAESTDPSRVSATLSGTDLTITGIASGTATVTVTATDPGGLIAAQNSGVTVLAENRAPVAIGAVPRQSMDAGGSLMVDVSSYFSDPDGDVLGYEAASTDTDVVTAVVSGSVVTINAVADGTATVSVSATDPDGLSATQGIEVVVGRESGGFRDDFESDELEGWDITSAGAALSEGVLQLTNASAGLPGRADRPLEVDLLDWEIRVSLGRIHDDVTARLVAYTGFAQIPAFAIEIGSGLELRGEDTNFRMLVLESRGGESQWQVAGGAYLDALSDSAGALAEISLSLKGNVLSAAFGDSTVNAEDVPADVPISAKKLIRVGLWTVPFGDEAERTALFDWIEVTGSESSAFLPPPTALRRDHPTVMRSANRGLRGRAAGDL
ncbi:Ig-like domain-containing protein [Candidatus Palauibacter sp.]|uniref:Ig-like domain-containing protein n=1 Tax=Candidatus Palauibacter sp. TaxID=3101350 RepID=UPI003AF211B9